MMEFTNEQLVEFCLSMDTDDLRVLDEGALTFGVLESWEKRLPPGVSVHGAICRVLAYWKDEVARYRANAWLTYLAECAAAGPDTSDEDYVT